MAKHKAQHVIPKSYLRAWCDPKTPAGQTPYIWRIPKDGGEAFKRSPEKSFTETDKYTIKMPNGDRNLILENTLAELENKFVRIRDRIRRRERLNDVDKGNLALFTAAMHARTNRAGDHWQKTQQELHDQVVAMEKAHDAEPVTSLQTGAMLKHAPQMFLAMSLEAEAPLYYGMELTIISSDDPDGFITSDTPCVWYDPTAYRRPPFYRPPGLAHKDVEVTLPVTPNQILMFSHHKYPAYIDVSSFFVEQANNRIRAFADKEFVSWKGISRPAWFARRPMPEDAWENTVEGKKAAQEQAEWDEVRKGAMFS